MAWAAVALLLASWAGIAIHDQADRQPDGQSAASDSTGTRSQPQVQTRTRGS
jgi:hypothetical protein